MGWHLHADQGLGAGKVPGVHQGRTWQPGPIHSQPGAGQLGGHLGSRCPRHWAPPWVQSEVGLGHWGQAWTHRVRAGLRQGCEAAGLELELPGPEESRSLTSPSLMIYIYVLTMYITGSGILLFHAH